MYRRAGLSLKNIKILLDDNNPSLLRGLLLKRFEELGEEIQTLYEQQKVLAGLLDNEIPDFIDTGLSREVWTNLLRVSGFTDNDMRKWHIQFERTDPIRYEIFLKHLNIPKKEREKIRGWSMAE